MVSMFSIRKSQNLNPISMASFTWGTGGGRWVTGRPSTNRKRNVMYGVNYVAENELFK